MTFKVIAQGAEAIIELHGKEIYKKRILKNYRITEIDSAIRKRRTKSETKLLEKASKITNTPKLIKTDKDNNQIIMEAIEGRRLSDNLDNLKNKLALSKSIGQEISKLHKEDIIHGDLTTSNMILKTDKIYFIDFGLGYISKKIEDKAVDLHLLKQALEAKHHKYYLELWKSLEKGYLSINKPESKKIIERLMAVEKRGRYKKGS